MRKKKVYNIHTIARIYASKFYTYIVDKGYTIAPEKLYSLFMYSIKDTLDLDPVDYTKEIRVYGQACSDYLKGIQKFSINANSLSLREREDLVQCSGIYLIVLMQAKGLV